MMMHNLWSSVARLFLLVGEKLCFLGRRLNIPSRLVIFTVIRLFLNDPFLFLNNLWSLLSLLFLLADVMFGFMGRKPGIGTGIGVSIIVLGVVAPCFGLNYQNGSPDFVTLIYHIARFLVFLSLMIEQTQRDYWLSHLLAGAAYACLTLGIIIYNFSRLPLEYAFAGFSTLFVFALFAVRYGFTSDKTH